MLRAVVLEPGGTNGSVCATRRIARSHQRHVASHCGPPGADAAAADITRDTKAFTAMVRTRIFTMLRAWSIGNHAAALEAVDTPRVDASEAEEPAPWTADRPRTRGETYKAAHGYLRVDPRRAICATHVHTADDGKHWVVQQVLVDPELENDWMSEWVVDLAASLPRVSP